MITAYSKPIPRIPKETARAASAVFGRSNFYILVGEHLEEILGSSSTVEDVMPPLITFFQFLEGLTDIQAMDAVRTRTDWKFALHLSLVSATPRDNELCEFRQKVFRDFERQVQFQGLIDRLVVFAPALNSAQTLKSLDVVSAVCSFNRLHRAQQAMNQALEVLAVRFPQWLRKIALPHWYGRYNPTAPRLELAILLGQQQFLMEEISSDIHHLLEKIQQSGLHEISELHEVRVLKQIWLQQFNRSNQIPSGPLEILSSTDCDNCFHSEAGRSVFA